MKNWLIVSRDKYFDLDKAFDSYWTITWPQVVDALPGDIVYIYEEGACDAIKYKCIVEETDLSTMDDGTVEFVWDLSFYDEASTYMRLQLLAELDKSRLSKRQLEAAGVFLHGSSELSYADTDVIEELAGDYSEIGDHAYEATRHDREEEPVHSEESGKGKTPAQDKVKSSGSEKKDSDISDKFSNPLNKLSNPFKKLGTTLNKYGKKRTIGIASVCIVLLLTIGYFTIHIYEPADCEHPKTCKICGKTQGTKLGHKWDSGKVIDEADCEHEGKMLYTCKNNSSHTREETIPAKGHNWKAADCEHPETCTECNATRGSALGHDWIEATYDAPMTCSRCKTTIGDKKGMVRSIPSHWADKTEDFYPKKGASVYTTPKEFSELQKCRWIKVEFGLDDKFLDHDWRIALRSNGSWDKWYTITADEIKAKSTVSSNGITTYTVTLNVNPSTDIDAIVFYPSNIRENEKWSVYIEPIEAQVD